MFELLLVNYLNEGNRKKEKRKDSPQQNYISSFSEEVLEQKSSNSKKIVDSEFSQK